MHSFYWLTFGYFVHGRLAACQWRSIHAANAMRKLRLVLLIQGTAVLLASAVIKREQVASAAPPT